MIIEKRIDGNNAIYEVYINKDYTSLFEIYLQALEHASETKGKERHYNNEPFEKQTICQTNREVGIGFGLGQCLKKSKEVVRLPPEKAIYELYGVINYAAGVAIILDEKIRNLDKKNNDILKIKDELGFD